MKKSRKSKFIGLVTFAIAMLMIMGLILPTVVTFIQIVQFGQIPQ